MQMAAQRAGLFSLRRTPRYLRVRAEVDRLQAMVGPAASLQCPLTAETKRVALERFHYLSHTLGAVLIFVGIKMAVSHWYHMNTYVSLAIIVAMLFAAIALSRRRRVV